MKKALLIIVTAVTFAFTANAQPYKNSLGISFMPDWSGRNHYLGVQWNHFVKEDAHLDIRGIYEVNWGPLVEGLYEWDFYFENSNFRFYTGPGVHFGFIPNWNGKGDNCATFGITGAAGFEYVFQRVPLAISIDWRPYLTFQPVIDWKPMFGYTGAGLTLKFYFD